MIDKLTISVIGILCVIVTAVMVPMLKAHTIADKQAALAAAARMAVYAAQQMYGPEEGRMKKEYALARASSLLKQYGLTVRNEDVSAAIEAALKEIKTDLTGEWTRSAVTVIAGGVYTTASKTTPDGTTSGKAKIVVRHGRDITVPKLPDGEYARATPKNVMPL